MKEGWNKEDSNRTIEHPLAALGFQVQIAEETFFRIIPDQKSVTVSCGVPDHCGSQKPGYPAIRNVFPFIRQDPALVQGPGMSD